MAPAAPHGKPRCCLRAGERRQATIPAGRNAILPDGSIYILPAGMHSCLQECNTTGSIYILPGGMHSSREECIPPGSIYICIYYRPVVLHYCR